MSAYLNTRVSLYAGRLWRGEQFQALLRAKAGDVPQALSDGGLPDLAEVVLGNDPRSLEQNIIARMLEEIVVLLRPLRNVERRFLIYWTERIELSNIKTLLRGKMMGERPAVLLNRLTPMGVFGRLNEQELAHAEDISELLRRLEAGPYASVVRHARRALEESQDPFILDAALDRGYYDGLVHCAQPIESTAGTSFRRLMGQLVDRINLVWLLRFRFNYSLPPAQVYFLLVSSRYGLPSARLRELAALQSLEAVLDALPEHMRNLLRDAREIPEIFARLEQDAADNADKVLHSGAPAFARAFAYLILRERDLRSVRAVVRGRSLGLTTEDIRFAMYQPPEGRA